MDHHRAFKVAFGVSRGDWGVDMHELAMRVLEHAGSFDGLDVPNLGSIEDVLRQAQLVEHAYGQLESPAGSSGGKAKGGKGKYGFDESAFFTGLHRETGELMICPELLDYVSKEVEKDVGIMKQLRKAREERSAAKKQSNKDDGK